MITPVITQDGIRFGTKMGITNVSMGAEEYVSQNLKYMDFVKYCHTQNQTPIFEWMSRKQRIVIDYPEDRELLKIGFAKFTSLPGFAESVEMAKEVLYGKRKMNHVETFYVIELDENNDEVIGMLCVAKTDITKQVLVVSEKGMGKRTPFLEKIEKVDGAVDVEGEVEPHNMVQIGDEKYLLSYRVTNRGGKGVKTINVTEKTGGLIGLVGVEETDDLMITCESGVTIRMKVSAIREAGRATQGVKLINIDEGDKIAAIARIAEQEEEEVVEGESAEGEGSETGVENNPAGEEGEASEAPAAE
jgi:hypothetical protein